MRQLLELFSVFPLISLINLKVEVIFILIASQQLKQLGFFDITNLEIEPRENKLDKVLTIQHP
jgi:hypothetical protein